MSESISTTPEIDPSSVDPRILKHLVSSYSLVGQTACVYGASGQMGTEIVNRLLLKGAEVIGVRSSEQGAEETRTSFRDLPGRVLGAVVCDFTKPETIEPARDGIAAILNGRPLDIAVINGGGVVKGVGPKETVDDFPREMLERALALNYLGPVLAIQSILRLMDAAALPRLGAVLSMSYRMALSRVFAYRNAKLALEDFVRFLPTELSKRPNKRWTVFGWRPGFVIADQNSKLMDEQRRAAILDHMPRARFQTAQEIAQVVVTTLTSEFAPSHGAIIDIAEGGGCAGLGNGAV